MTTTYDFILDTGTIVADTSSIQTDVGTEWKNALGANLDTDASTSQGTLITAETLARTNVMRNNAEIANNFNPNYAYGTFLDAVCALLGISRGVNQPTIGSSVTITGNNLTTVQSGSRVQTSAGDIFTVVAPVTIGITGTALVQLKSQASGNIPLPVGSLTILDGTIGWGSASVTVATTVVLGTLALKDGALKNRRNQQLAQQGTGSSAAIMAAVYGVKNVTSAQVVENNTGVAGVVNGVTFTKPNAMWVCVAGTPDQNELAQALYAAHAGGCPWDFGAAGNGLPFNPTTGVLATDPSTGLTYYVMWTTPILYDCYVSITIRQSGNVSSPQNAVQNAIIAYANGQETGEPGLVVGASVSAYEMGGAVVRQLPGMYVKSCSIACVPNGSAAPLPGAYIPEFVMAPFGQAVLSIGNIAVTLAP